MKQHVITILGFMARKLIEAHKPTVIAITGTVGKTTATHAIYGLLSRSFGKDVYMSPYDYNGEFGVPLTILQAESPKWNPFGWIMLLYRFVVLRFSSSYPKYLVLEYGLDHPGEMDFLLSVARPDVAVILNVSPNHVANFTGFAQYAAEKLKLVRWSAFVVYNADDARIADCVRSASVPSSSYSIASESDFRATDIEAWIRELSFSVRSAEGSERLRSPVSGDFLVYNFLAAYAVGKKFGMIDADMADSFAEAPLLKGRGTILAGVKDAVIIDGSYNGGFASISAGITHVASQSGDYAKIVCIGDMRELGPESREMHGKLADLLSDTAPDYVFLVGEETKRWVFPVVSATLPNVFSYHDSRNAGAKIREVIQSSDKPCIAFFKGSQNTIFLEEAVKAILADVRDQSKLCRQSPSWLQKKRNFFDTMVQSDAERPV